MKIQNPQLLWPKLTREYSDAKTASLGDKPFGTVDQLVLDRLDRLSRNLRHFTTLFEELAEARAPSGVGRRVAFQDVFGAQNVCFARP